MSNPFHARRSKDIHLSTLAQPPATYPGGAWSSGASESATNMLTAGGGPSLSSSLSPLGSPMQAPPHPAPPMASRDGPLDEFQDFDDPHVYQSVYKYSLDPNALNFVVQFGDAEAQVACGLGAGQFKQLLQQSSEARNSSATPVRWINIWNPHKQREVVEAIGERYHFSKRLRMSIWAWDIVKMELVKRKAAAHDERMQKFQLKPVDGNNTNNNNNSSGVATAAAAASAKLAMRGSMDMSKGNLKDVLAPENLVTFKMMQDNLNYTSMDQESEFVCIGANWLHRRPDHALKRATSLIPSRHWSWFVFCDDHTVITFHEAAYYDKAPKGEDVAAWNAQELKNMRSNTIKVLRQLSKCGLEEDRHKFGQLTSVREPDRHLEGEEHRQDSASNLFYYLFEDYAAALDVLDNSKTALDDISSRILHTANWKSRDDVDNIIPLLYKLNKELRELHHLFTNYKNTINRLIGCKDKRSGDGSGNDGAAVHGGATKKGRLSVKAVNRFKRLQEQMQSLMLDAMADSLHERQSLHDTYFNLMTQMASRSTERLTRSATLLSKLGVFFLPISFMTSYFSVQIPHMSDNYTAKTYWGAFGVIASISFLCLFFFSKVLMFMSERLDHASENATRWTYGRVGCLQRRQMRAMEEEDGV